MILKEKQFTETQSMQQAAGDRQEKSVAFYLRPAFKNHESVFVFHDLNITYGGEFAQIDHLVVYKYGFILIESKSITGEVRVNSESEWSRSYHGQWRGIPSPVKQVELQLALLKELLSANVEKLLGKLFNKLQTQFGGRKWESLCAISSNAIIDRSQVPDAINGRMVKSEFVADKVTEIMNLPSKLRAKAGFLLDDRAWFSDEEVERICKFLLAVDKKTLELKSKGNAAEQPAPNAIEEPKPTVVVQQEAKQVSLKYLGCKKCGEQTNLTGKWGKFGYYVQCNACEANTSLKINCPSCQSDDVKNRKDKLKFYVICAACGTETLIHENLPIWKINTFRRKLESRLILCGKFSLKDLTHGLIIGHVIQANATRLILVHHNPAGDVSLKDKHLLEACWLKEKLLEYSLLLDDFILVSKTSGNGSQMNTMSLARLGLV